MMRLNITTPAMLLVSFLVSLAGKASAEEGTAHDAAPATVEQAKVTADAIVAKVNQPGKIPPDYRARWATELLCLLDSDDARIRAVAIERFPKIRDIRLDECVPYLRDERLPLRERMALLVLCVKQFGGYGVTCSSQEAAEDIKKRVKDVLDDDACPPMFVELTVALARSIRVRMPNSAEYGVTISEFIPDGGSTLAARRFMFSIEDIQQAYGKDKWSYFHTLAQRVFDMVISLGEKQAGPAIEEWYQIEADPDARRVVVAKNLHWTELPEWRERRKAILKLAANDWDEEIAAKAKALLAEVE